MDLFYIRNELNNGNQLTNIKLRVTDYSRVSTDDVKQKKSLQNQIEHFSEYIKNNPKWTYVEGYVDEGISGTSDKKREQFIQMINDAKNNKFDLILTKEISRFSRNTLDSIKYTRELLSYGVAVLFVNDNINTAMPDSELRLTIMASMAQDEIRRLSERVKFGMNRAIEKGEILGNDTLYGYKKNKESGYLEIIPEEAEVIKRLYRLYSINELSLNKITKIFNEENIKTKMLNKWSVSTLSRMITNPKYMGYYCGNKTKVSNFITKKIEYLNKEEWKVYKDNEKIPPIISERLWNKANTRIKHRKKSKEIYKDRYLYSSKIYCLECNKIYHRRKFIRTKNDYSWVCSKYLLEGKNVCDSPNIRESELKYIFNDIITILFFDKEKIRNILLDLYKIDAVNNYSKTIDLLEEKKAKIILKKEKLLDLNLENILSSSEFSNKYIALDNEIEEINKEIRNKKNSDYQSDLPKVILKKIQEDFIKEKIIKIILNKIIVSKKNNKNDLKLNIYLNLKSHKELLKYYHFKRENNILIKYKVNYIFI